MAPDHQDDDHTIPCGARRDSRTSLLRTAGVHRVFRGRWQLALLEMAGAVSDVSAKPVQNSCLKEIHAVGKNRAAESSPPPFNLLQTCQLPYQIALPMASMRGHSGSGSHLAP